MKVAARLGGLLGILALVLASDAEAQQQVRVATYNIFFLREDIPQARSQRLRAVIEQLDADVIGMQEIADREALEAVFDPQQWHLVIDDDSTDNQDVAVAVRKPLAVVDLNQDEDDLDADDDDFLFSGGQHPDVPGNNANFFFPNRRDVLAVDVRLPSGTVFTVLVQHAKSRSGGRAATDNRREGAARALVRVLERDFDDRDFVLLGDLNDNPDDRSLNILETGDPDALGGPEGIQGPFLINLTEPLLEDDRVSWGLNAGVVGPNGRIDTRVPGSRALNNAGRGTPGTVHPILFDQILIPGRMEGRFVSGSAAVFDGGVALEGSGNTRASDHLPVSAVLVFSDEEPEDGGLPGQGVRIASLLPNPDGEDSGHEQVSLRNTGAAEVNLDGWVLRDRAGNSFPLSGRIAAGGTRTFTLPAGQLPLNNSGDDLHLHDAEGDPVHLASYRGADARSGRIIRIED